VEPHHHRKKIDTQICSSPARRRSSLKMCSDTVDGKRGPGADLRLMLLPILAKSFLLYRQARLVYSRQYYPVHISEGNGEETIFLGHSILFPLRMLFVRRCFWYEQEQQIEFLIDKQTTMFIMHDHKYSPHICQCSSIDAFSDPPVFIWCWTGHKRTDYQIPYLQINS